MVDRNYYSKWPNQYKHQKSFKLFPFVQKVICSKKKIKYQKPKNRKVWIISLPWYLVQHSDWLYLGYHPPLPGSSTNSTWTHSELNFGKTLFKKIYIDSLSDKYRYLER